jgi:hypothetical protein
VSFFFLSTTNFTLHSFQSPSIINLLLLSRNPYLRVQKLTLDNVSEPTQTSFNAILLGDGSAKASHRPISAFPSSKSIHLAHLRAASAQENPIHGHTHVQTFHLKSLEPIPRHKGFILLKQLKTLPPEPKVKNHLLFCPSMTRARPPSFCILAEGKH